MNKLNIVGFLFICFCASLASAENKIVFQDDFNREETNPKVDSIGNHWGTNSKNRAAGNKQVTIDDGVLHIFRHKVADHGVSVVQDMDFQDAEISLRFKIRKEDELGINIADMKEKSVHAGHLFVTKVRAGKVMLMDLKTSTMNLEVRARNKAKKLTADDKALLKKTRADFKNSIEPEVWHQLQIKILKDTLSVSIDGTNIGTLKSPGIAHPTKRRLRIAVPKQAWVDDLKVTQL